MESFEDKFHKELKSKNIHNKNYLWLITFVLTTSIVAYYSYTHQIGVISKQTIDKEFTVKNQNNLRELFQENIHNFTPQNRDDSREKSLYESVVIVQNKQDNPEDITEDEQLTATLNEGPDVDIDDEQIALGEIPLTSPEVQQAQSIIKQTSKPKVEKTSQTKQTKQNKKSTPSTSKQVALLDEQKKEFDLVKCYNLKSNTSTLTPLCQKKIGAFLQKYNKASQYEVIGIIDLIDEKEVIQKKSYASVYTLGENRIKNAKAFIKRKLGNKVTILEHEYTLKTELESRGVVIRAYN